jgi:hypothetical protein
LKNSYRFFDLLNRRSPGKPSDKRRRRQSDSGQIIIEYVLLLAFAVVIAVFLTRTMIAQDRDSAGFIIQAWSQAIMEIGADEADDIPVPPN